SRLRVGYSGSVRIPVLESDYQRWLMTRIVLDETLRNKLGDLTHPIEICDEAGHVLGRITPVFDPALYEELTPPISKEELQRRKESKEKTYTTAEVLAYLEKL